MKETVVNAIKPESTAAADERNIHQRLHAVMGEVSYIQKDRNVGNYKVVSHDAVTAKVRPVLVKHGVIYYPQNMIHTQNGNRTEVHLDIVFVNVANPKDSIAIPTFGYGIDQSDKGPGKAVSYAVKMALLKALGLETGEDADDGTDAKHEPPKDHVAQAAERMASNGGVDKVKNPAGRSGVVTKVRELAREVHGCAASDELLALINTDDFKKFAFKVCREFPNDWLGPEDNSGLSGIIAQAGVNLGCQNETDRWVHLMERARDAANIKAAE